MATILQLKVTKRQLFEKVSLEHCLANVQFEPLTKDQIIITLTLLEAHQGQ